MKRKLHSAMLAIMMMVLAVTTHAQSTSINTTTPDASAAFQVNSASGVSQGVLIPSVALTATNAALPLVLPAPTLFVYNTATAGVAPNNVSPGYYYNAGTAAAPNWVRLLNQSSGWQTIGNRGTTASTSAIGTAVNNNFIGTTDATDFVFATNNLERMRLFNSGQLSIGSLSSGAKLDIHQTTSTATLRLYNYGNANEMEFRRSSGTQAAQTATGAGSIVGRLLGVGYDGSTYNNRTIAGISFVTETTTSPTNSSGRIVFSTTPTGTTSATGGTERMRIVNDGRIAVNNTAPAATDLLTVTSSTTFPYAINGYNAQASGSGLYASNTNTANAFSALDGDHNGSAGSGVLGSYVGASTGTGISGATGQYIGTATTGIRIGVRGYSGNADGNQNLGIYGTYNTSSVLAYGVGVHGVAYGGGIIAGNIDAAIVGWRADNANYSGYFNGNHVIANGTKSASVGTSKGNQLLYVTETPGVWFEDIGSAQLINGKAVVNLDPLFLETVFIDPDHPMQVFVQEQGECNDLYVIPGTTSFEVIEKQGGTSSVRFSYRIMAKRLHFQDHRFGCDPVWGSGDTRKYNQYATPPPVDYRENVEFQEQQKRNWKPTPMPDGFTYELGTSQQTKSTSLRDSPLNKNEETPNVPNAKKGFEFKNQNK